MINFENLLKNNSKQIHAVLDTYLLNFINQKETLIKAMRYSLLFKGKKLRSFLIYQVGNMLGLNRDSLNAAAAAIECIHSYSLIHDDLPTMDNSTLRHGKLTCHIKFNESIAILAGNSLQALAFNIMANASMPSIIIKNRLKMISALAIASGANGLCFGQTLDLKNKNKKKSISHLNKIYKFKTGALIRAAVQMAILASDKQNDQTLYYYLDKYAANISLAFQIQDDILDVTGDNKITGKKCGVDKKLNKNTYPELIGLNMSKNKTKDLYYKSLKLLKYISALGYDVDILSNLAKYIIIRDK